MKASLPFKYITAVKRGKHYVIFDYRDDEGNRKRKWVGTGLPEKCKKKDLTTKIDELVSEFYKEYMENNIERPRLIPRQRKLNPPEPLRQLKTDTRS